MLFGLGGYITERMRFGAMMACAAWLLCCPPANGAPQDLATVRAVALSFVQDRMRQTPGEVRIHVNAPDAQLALPACPRLNAFAPAGVRYWGPASVGVRCESPNAWTLYLQVQVQVLGDAAVAARSLSKGDIFAAADVQVQRVDLTQIPRGTAVLPEAVIGLVAKGPIAGGTVLSANMLRGPPLVSQGEAVRLAYVGDGFEISTDGRALTGGAMGEFVSVKAPSGRVLRATVVSKGTVLVR